MEIKPAADALAKSARGGKRAGAGRPKKGQTSPTSIAPVDLAAALQTAPPDEIDAVAKHHARSAIDTLVKQITFGASETARVSAANALLDRGYGKPTVEVGGDAMLPFFGTAPVQPTTSVATDIREEARKYARLAIEVLHRIATGGKIESARVQAAKSLLDRGLGTVAAARMLNDLFDAKPQSVGKKEATQQAAEAASTGRYAPRAPPRLPPSPETMQ